MKKKVNAIQQLDKISRVLGPERTNSELLPYIMDIVDDEDEVLLELAKALGDFLGFLGGKKNLAGLIKPLESLCTVEEGTVRDQAAKSINKILGQVKVKDFEDEFIGLFTRLIKGDWFTSKVSATMILPSLYPNVSSSGQKGLFKLFSPLCEDSIPQVRKAAAIALTELVLHIPKAPEADLLELFLNFQKDSQDLVKMQGVEALLNFAKVLDSSKFMEYFSTYIKGYAEDKSWRTRYLFANKIDEFGK